MKQYLKNWSQLLAFSVLALLAAASFAGQPAGTTGGAPTTMIGPLAATKVELINNSGTYEISSIMAVNVSTAAAFIQWFDQPCAGVTVGTTRPSWVTPVNANNWTSQQFPVSLTFLTPICVVSTTTPAGAVGSAANSIYMQVFVP